MSKETGCEVVVSNEEIENEEALSTENQHCNEIKQWIEFEAPFFGRTDEEFILVFLRGCKLNITKTKKKMTMYYENRVKAPQCQWWANRYLTNESIKSLAHLKTTVALIDKDSNSSTIAFTIGERFGPDLGNFDDYGKLSSLILEVMLKRLSSQKHGIIWIIDGRNYPGWIVRKFLWPTTMKSVLTSFYMSTPLKLRKLILLDCPPIVTMIFKMVKALISEKLKQRIYFYGSDWSKLNDHVDMNLLPEEYGGNAGPIQLHDDLFLQELFSYADYFSDDNKYGFQ